MSPRQLALRAPPNTPAVPAPQGEAVGITFFVWNRPPRVCAHLSAWAGRPAHPSQSPADSVPVPSVCTWPCCLSRCPLRPRGARLGCGMFVAAALYSGKFPNHRGGWASLC